MATSLVGCHLRNILLSKAGTCLSVSQFREVCLGARKRSSGAVRQGGGAFSKREEALEEMYFRKREKELIDTMKAHHEEGIDVHEKEIKRLQEKIKWHESKLEHLDDQQSSD